MEPQDLIWRQTEAVVARNREPKGGPMTPDEHLDLAELRTLSAQEVADAVGVPIETVWSAAKNGSLYGRKLGREWRFTLPAVREWVGLPVGESVSAPPRRRTRKSAGSGTPD
jgi:excisionase family DNA binding protein